MSEVILDVRDLEAPEPLERVLEALCTLSRGDCIRMIHRMEPRPLYSILDQEGFDHQTTFTDEGYFEILITHRNP